MCQREPKVKEITRDYKREMIEREGGFIAMEEKEDVTDQYKEKGGRGWGKKEGKNV